MAWVFSTVRHHNGAGSDVYIGAVKIAALRFFRPDSLNSRAWAVELAFMDARVVCYEREGKNAMSVALTELHKRLNSPSPEGGTTDGSSQE